MKATTILLSFFMQFNLSFMPESGCTIDALHKGLELYGGLSQSEYDYSMDIQRAYIKGFIDDEGYVISYQGLIDTFGDFNLHYVNKHFDADELFILDNEIVFILICYQKGDEGPRHFRLGQYYEIQGEVVLFPVYDPLLDESPINKDWHQESYRAFIRY